MLIVTAPPASETDNTETRHQLELVAAFHPIASERTATSAADEKLAHPVPIQIKPRHARPALAPLERQQRLPREVVKRLLVMTMIQRRADIGKQRSA